MGNYGYVAVCSVALGASAPTEGGEGRGHIVAAARLQLVYTTEVQCILNWPALAEFCALRVLLVLGVIESIRVTYRIDPALMSPVAGLPSAGIV